MDTQDHSRTHNLAVVGGTDTEPAKPKLELVKSGGGLLHRTVAPETLGNLLGYLKFEADRARPHTVSNEALRAAREYGAIPLIVDMVLFDHGGCRLLEKVLQPRRDLFVARGETAFGHREDTAEHWHSVSAATAFLIRCRDVGLNVDPGPLVELAKERLPDTRFMTMDEATVHAWPKRQGGRHPWTLTAPEGGIAVRSDTFTTATGHTVTAKLGSDGAVLAMTFVPPPAASVKIGEPQPRYRSAQREARVEPQVEKALRPLHQKRKARTVARKHEMAARTSA